MDPRRLLGVPRGLDHPLVGPLPGDGLTLAVLVLKRAPLVARVRALRGEGRVRGKTPGQARRGADRLLSETGLIVPDVPMVGPLVPGGGFPMVVLVAVTSGARRALLVGSRQAGRGQLGARRETPVRPVWTAR